MNTSDVLSVVLFPIGILLLCLFCFCSAVMFYCLYKSRQISWENVCVWFIKNILYIVLLDCIILAFCNQFLFMWLCVEMLVFYYVRSYVLSVINLGKCTEKEYNILKYRMVILLILFDIFLMVV